MQPHRPVERKRSIPKPLVVAMIVVASVGAVVTLIPFLFFFLLAVSGAELG